MPHFESFSHPDSFWENPRRREYAIRWEVSQRLSDMRDEMRPIGYETAEWAPMSYESRRRTVERLLTSEYSRAITVTISRSRREEMENMLPPEVQPEHIISRVIPSGEIPTVSSALDRRHIIVRSMDYESRDPGSHTGLQYAPLENANLREIHFEDIDFFHANLARANLEKTHLKSCSMTWSNLEEANFTGAVLDRTSMSDANCRETTFIGANISAWSMWTSDFAYADFTGARLTEERFSDCFLHAAIFDRATLNAVSFSKTSSEVSMAGASFVGADISDTSFWYGCVMSDFSDATIAPGSSMNGTYWLTRFYNATLRNVDFTWARLNWADFRKADISWSDFSHTDMGHVRIDGDVRMQDADFRDANIIDMMIDGVRVNRQNEAYYRRILESRGAKAVRGT